MTVHHSVFAERLFEFLFNAEFIHKNSASVIGMPHIPSQEEEKWLGYDVAFNLQNGGGVINALALQHKVVRLVDGPGSGANKAFRNAAGNPYFAFPVDPVQFNTIEALVSQNLPGLEFYFCAPLFVDQPNLDARYAAKDLDAHSVYIDVNGVGQLDESISHSIVYTPNGNEAWVFSEDPKSLTIRRVAPGEQNQNRQREEVSLEQIQRLYSTAFELVANGYARRVERQLARRLPKDVALVGQFSALSRQLQEGAPVRVSFDSKALGWLAISRLFAIYLDATTIVQRCAA
ncbi:MAG: hypothetical protein O9335_07390 [Inhella sp.]|uniref:hypothetical protein n=1 Tax=Inhella sp. TaxID=1921806 RepID=UPI0022C6D598|nr:hypothetical protein [Inhella sp.]MCZ8234965.1 hypothetical protein [Inhella sp.]